MINKIALNNLQPITFKADNNRVVYPNEFVFDDVEERKMPTFDFSTTEEKTASIAEKKEPVFKKISKKLKNFIKAANNYRHYRSGIKKAVKINVITKERAKEILNEQKTLLLNILKK